MKIIKIKANILFPYLFLLFFCSNYVYSETGNKMIIKGSLNNLPDGKMYLIGWANKILDSTDTKNGKFEFSRTLIDNESERFTLKHRDNQSIVRIFAFLTKKTSNGYPLASQFFMSDPVIVIEGELINLKTTITLPKNLLLVNSPITAGKQSQALFDIDFELQQKPDVNFTDKINNLILLYPYSYYLLAKIIDHKNDYTNAQIDGFLKLLNPEVKNSKSAKALLEFTGKRSKNKKDLVEKLYTTAGIQENLINSNSKLSLIVFWASWCGPCRQEIPVLKKLHEEYKSKSVDFVSVSVDEDNNKWLKAVEEENMPWRQLRVKPEQFDFLKIVFQYDSTIPFIVVVDKEYKILLRLTGSSDENNRVLLKFLNDLSI